MDYVYAFAGIPEAIFADVRNKFSQIAPGRCHFISRPHKGNSYSTSDIKYYIGRFAEIIGSDAENRLYHARFSLFYIDYEDQNSVDFAEAFSPHILTVKVKFSLDAGASHQENSKLKNELVENLKRITANAKNTLDVLKKEISEKSNKTPLLLPLQNFHSDVLMSSILNLYNQITSASDKQGLIKNVINQIQQAHPHGTDTGKNYRYIDNRKVNFTAPGKSLHGISRPNTGHPDICLISANIRLGAKYPRGFHYDCTANRGNLAGEFYGCHHPRSHKTGNPHLNISPNDHVR